MSRSKPYKLEYDDLFLIAVHNTSYLSFGIHNNPTIYLFTYTRDFRVSSDSLTVQDINSDELAQLESNK